jgi:transposase
MAAKKGGAGFADFLERLAHAWPNDDLVLVLDNVSYHRSPSMRSWWAVEQGRALPFWLPAYRPNLNLLERVWHVLKQKLACRHFWADREGLRQAAITLLDQTEAHFHTPKRPAIRLAHNFCQSA